MRHLAAVILAVCVCSTAWGNACSTTGSGAGNWSSAAVWTSCGGGVPGNGDTVTSISRPITVDVNTTVGSSPAAGGTSAIIVTGTSGSLTVASGVTLTARGDVQLNNATLALGADSVLEFDPTQASSPSTALYVLYVGTANTQNSIVNITGTSGHPGIIRTNSGAVSTAYAWISDGAWQNGGRINAQYATLLRLGSATQDGWRYDAHSGTTQLQYTTLDTVGRVFQDGGACGASASLIFQFVRWTNSPGSNARLNSCNSSGTVLWDNVSSDGYVSSGGTMTGWTLTNSFWTAASPNASPDFPAGAWVKFQNNYIYTQITNAVVFPGDIKDLYMSNPSTNTPSLNQHWTTYSGARAFTFDGLLFEDDDPSDAVGDGVLADNTAGGSIMVKNSIKLPGAGGQSSGTMFSALGGANTVMRGEHNTVHLGGDVDSSGYRYGETYSGYAGMYPSIRCNLFWDTTVRGFKITADPPPGVTDVVTLADYNGGYLFAAGTEGLGYNITTSATPGQHDVTGNPMFVDSTRNIATWAVLRGQANAGDSLATKQAAARAYIQADATQVGARIADLISYVRAGFVPQFIGYAYTCYDGSNMGAQTARPFAAMMFSVP